jgi:2-keto-4-pentenoate hydratase/2-oxohepta-3-ene-1,7-dioic acid hydratase in catechol pathway
VVKYGTAMLRGERRAVVIDGPDAWLSESGDLGHALADGFDQLRPTGQPVATSSLTFDVPVRPPVILCTGQNYHDHLAEKPAADPDFEFFLKAGQTIAGPADDLVIDERVSRKFDYETELGIVIGRPARHVSPAAAVEHIAGFVVLNDVTARDRQVRLRPDGSAAMSLGPGKNFDGATRIGRFMVPAAAVPDPQNLRLRTWVDGRLRQDNSTANMIHSVAEVVAWISTLLTLQPGLVIATGTPGGTGWGMDADLGGTGITPPGCEPARYLTAGQRVRGEIDQVGECEFAVVARATPNRRLGEV